MCSTTLSICVRWMPMSYNVASFRPESIRAVLRRARSSMKDEKAARMRGINMMKLPSFGKPPEWRTAGRVRRRCFGRVSRRVRICFGMFQRHPLYGMAVWQKLQLDNGFATLASSDQVLHCRTSRTSPSPRTRLPIPEHRPSLNMTLDTLLIVRHHRLRPYSIPL